MTPTATPRRAVTLAQLLAGQAEIRPDHVAMRFIEPGGVSPAESDVTELTFAELDRKSAQLALHLMTVADAGDRVLLLCPPGPDYVAALFGCLYAGLIAVPAYPPMTNGVDERLRLLFEDSTPRAILTTELLSDLCRISGIVDLASSAGASTLTIDTLAPFADDSESGDISESGGSFDTHGALESRSGAPDDIALLQYTSGSTGNPRGVMLSHLNILANVEAIVAHSDGTVADRGVFWLPPYHDMGLIGGIFTPIVEGAETTLMSPLSFLADPLLWLDAITRYQGTFSAAPNFAYDFCTRKATDARIANLDLTSWRIVINGAEPVQPATMQRFTERFAPAGFRASGFMPCYGLAEATLMVTGTRAGAGVKTANLQAPGQSRPSEIVSSGVPSDNGLALVVDPATTRPCEEGEVGEIWFQGPSVSRGYWSGGQESEEVFQATLGDEPDRGTFLRTGDLGLCRNGELFVTGRLKDVIIVRGQNYYPHDIENTLSQADAGLRPGCIAVFEAHTGGAPDDTSGDAPDDASGGVSGEAPGIVAVAETTAAIDVADIEQIAAQAREAVAREHGLTLGELVLIERGTSLKTSSGKIRRRPTRDAYLNGEFVVQARSLGNAGNAGRLTRAASSGAEGTQTIVESTQAMLVSAISEILGIESVSPDDDFLALGGDSLNAVELAAAAAEHGAAVTPADIYRFPTARLLSAEIERRRGGEPAAARGAAVKRSPLSDLIRGEIPRIADAEMGSYPLGPIQRRWAADYLIDRSKTWGNLSVRLALPDGGDVQALEDAVSRVWDVHESLRTIFPEANGELRQRILPIVGVPIAEHDLSELPAEEQVTATAKIAAAEASSVFDLANGPTARVALVRAGPGSSQMILTLHHMVADGWSLMELREQLAAAYGHAARVTAPVRLPTPPVRYRDYAAWMNEVEAGELLSDFRRYWLKELDGELPVTLPVDEELACGDDTKGASHLTVLPTELSVSLRELAKTSRFSLSAWLLGAFFLTLRRRTGERDLIVGTPLAGRDRKDIKDVIGMFINLVPIRLRFQRDWELADVVAATHEQLIGAVTHQRYQLDRMMEDLELEREPHRFAITNVFFSKMGMGRQTLGPQTGATIANDLPIDVRYQMMLYAYDFADGLVIDCRYRKVLFEAAKVGELVEDYTAILRAAAA